jgi:hypothetical protein
VTGFAPSVRFAGDVMVVHLSEGPAVRDATIECVVDETDLREVLGVEILDLRRQTGGSLPLSPEGDVHWSYDAEVDAAYVRVRGRDGSQVQRTATATARLDAGDTIVALDVPLAGAGPLPPGW